MFLNHLNEKHRVKIPVIVLFSVLLIGCPGKNPDLKEDSGGTKAEQKHNSPADENEREIKYEQWSKVIGEQFWPFSLKEYQLQEKEADVVRGSGGRWITVRYLLRDGCNIPKAEMAQRIIQAFEYYGWKQADLPEGKYVLSAIYETAKDDLHFIRGPFTSNDVVLHYKITIHISDNSQVLVLYCEAAW